MRGRPTPGGAGGDWSTTMQPLSVVLIVLIVGACYYLWRQRYMRSRAAWIVVAATIAFLIYLGFFTQPAWQRY